MKFAATALYTSDSDSEMMTNNAPKYSDFFGDGSENSETGDEEDGEEEEEEEEDSEDEEAAGSGGDDDSEERSEGSEEETLPKTNYQKRKEALRNQIEELEQQSMAAKDWELRGEVKSRERPENSLLTVAADIER